MMTPEEKELRSIYNFYKDTKKVFLLRMDMQQFLAEKRKE